MDTEAEENTEDDGVLNVWFNYKIVLFFCYSLGNGDLIILMA